MRRSVSLFVVLVLASTACGARLTDEQRLAAVGGLANSTGGQTTGSTGQTTTTGATGPAATTGSTGTTGTTGAAGTAATGTTTTTGTTGTTGGTQQGCGAGAGGATDTGVTAREVTIATVSDISGVQPGLFKSTHQAIQAVAAYVNSQGGICGRTLKPLLLDSKADSSANRAAVLDACRRAFAIVGSMSAFDDGGANDIDKCGIPDMSAIPVNRDRAYAKNMFAAYPLRPDYVMVGPGVYTAREHPQAVKKAAMLWLNAAVARTNAQTRMAAYEKAAGFEYIYKQAVQLVEANYSSYVQAMKNAGVEYVSMVGDFQSVIRLLKAMRQQQWRPEVLDFDSVVYDPDFHAQAEGVGEGLQVFVNTGLLEETQSNPEMQLYQQWLQRVAPGAQADYFGMYAWSAGRLFADLATKIGPKLTRAELLDELKKVRDWTGHGMHAPHDIGIRTATNCFVYAEVKGQSFARKFPKKAWNCDHSLVRV